MSLTLKQIISAILIVVLVVVVGWWGSDTLTTLGHKFEWDLFITQEEISTQKDARDIFEDTFLLLSLCAEDESNNCFCTKSEIGYPTGYSLLIEKKGMHSLLKLNTPKLELVERTLDSSFCFILEPWKSAIDLNVGQLILLYGTNDLHIDEFEGNFDSSLLFYKVSDNICIISESVAKEYDLLTLECSQKDESFEDKDDALSSFDSSVRISSLNNLISLVSLNLDINNNLANLLKGIIFIESYDSGIFINTNIVYDPSKSVYMGGNKKGLSMLEFNGFRSVYDALNGFEGEEIVDVYGYDSIDWNNEKISAVLINDNEFAIALAYSHLLNNYSGEQIYTTQDIFDIWLKYYNGKSITYSQYQEKMNILNNHNNNLGVTDSSVLGENSSPHII
ncbi:hypothetical protein HOD61_01985 [archaeon]|nr:hypothetical protein [archaeon]